MVAIFVIVNKRCCETITLKMFKLDINPNVVMFSLHSYDIWQFLTFKIGDSMFKSVICNFVYFDKTRV